MANATSPAAIPPNGLPPDERSAAALVAARLPRGPLFVPGVPVSAASPVAGPAEVSLLVGARNGVVAVYASRAEAEAKRDKYNADPFLADEMPDHDAPYAVHTWAVSS